MIAILSLGHGNEKGCDLRIVAILIHLLSLLKRPDELLQDNMSLVGVGNNAGCSAIAIVFRENDAVETAMTAPEAKFEPASTKEA